MRIVVIVLSVVAVSVSAWAETVTLQTTLDRLLGETTRGRIIAGQRRVVEDKYAAERIGYYLPEISFNTTLPSYQQSEDYDVYPGSFDPILFKRSDVTASGNVRLRQKIITGGDLTFESRINIRNNEYPSPVPMFRVDDGDTTRYTIYQTALDKRRLTNLYLQFSQPLFRTSVSRAAYHQAQDNLEKANVEFRQERADLKKEGITAYFDLLIADIDKRIAENQRDLAAYNAKWDSVKFVDGVITEEDWIESKSERLEKLLAVYDAEASLEEKTNNFTHLLDLPSDADLNPTIPPIPQAPDAARAELYLGGVENSAEVELARINMEMAEEMLAQKRSSYGINGTLNASYSIGRGTVTQSKPEQEREEQIDTKDWRVSLDFSYPIWDGGASGADVHSQELAYESARLEYLAAQRSAENTMEIRLQRIEINNAKLSLLTQEVDLAETKLRDAESRFEEGIISQATLLENRVYYLEAGKSRLTTLRDYYLDLTELEKTALQ